MNTNKYFSDEKPWELAKNDLERMNTVLWVTCEMLRNFGIILQPVLVDGSKKLLDLFHKGLAYYHNQEWDKAIETFTESDKLEDSSVKIPLLSDSDLTIKTPKVDYVLDQFTGGFKSIKLASFD